MPQNSKNYKLFRTNRNEHETCECPTIQFEEYHELKCKCIKPQVKNKLQIDIDILAIDNDKSKVELLGDKIHIFNKESSSSNIEIVLY